MKVIDVVHKKYYVESWVYIDMYDYKSVRYKRFSATGWVLDDNYPYAISAESLEEAYQVYLKEKEGRSMKVTDIVHNEIDFVDYVHFDFGKSGVYQRKSSTEWDTIFNCNLVEKRYLEEAYQTYLKENEKKEPSMKVMNVVYSEDGVVYSIVYIKIDGAYFSYRRYHAEGWYIDGCSAAARERERLEEAYQVYLKERILLKEEIMKKNSMPTTPGLYWAKSVMMKNRMFDYIVRVKGKSPMLYVDWVFDRITGKFYNTDDCSVDDVGVWGPKIDDPDEKEE